MEYLLFNLKALLANWQEALSGGFIVSCAVIFIVGLLKKAKLGKIENKNLRKFALWFSSIVLAFPVTAFYFWTNNISFGFYWIGSALSAVYTIVVYSCYENMYIRDIVDSIGQKTVGKWFEAIREAFVQRKKNKELQNSLKKSTDELKEDIKKELKSIVKHDDDLKDL